MAFHPIPDVAKLTLSFYGPQNQLMSVSTHWTLAVPAPMTALQVAGLAGDADTEFGTHCLTGLVIDSVRYAGAEARALDTISSPVHFANANAGFGGIASAPLPLEASILFSIQSGLAGRSHRNRFYWPAIGVAYLDTGSKNGHWLPGTVSGYLSAWLAFVAAMNTASWTQVVASPKLGTYTGVTGTTVTPRPASQRRRVQ
jgi:hypothetical protein